MPFLFPSASPSSSPEEVWKTAFHELSQRIRRYFVRQEPHQQALAYLQGLMSPLERKNGWQVALRDGGSYPVCYAASIGSSQVGLRRSAR